MDEMKIQAIFVWDKHSSEVIGCVDLGDTERNFATLEKTDTIATYILAFLIHSIVNPFKFSLANFTICGVNAAQLFPLFRKTVGICEKNSLKVLLVP